MSYNKFLNKIYYSSFLFFRGKIINYAHSATSYA